MLKGDFDFRAYMTRAPFAQMARAVNDLGAVMNGAGAKRQEIEASKDLTHTGRMNAKREHVKNHVVPVIKSAIETIGLAKAEIAKIRSTMAPFQIDKTDIAGALRRQEIRTWFRGLDPAKKTGMLTMHDELDPEIAAAIIEVPAELSGAHPNQLARLRERAAVSRHPEEAKNIATLSEAIDALDDHIQKATHTVGKEYGVPDINDLSGTSLKDKIHDRIGSITADLPDGGRGEKPTAAVT